MDALICVYTHCSGQSVAIRRVKYGIPYGSLCIMVFMTAKDAHVFLAF